MKKISKFAAIFTALALVLALAACSHPNSGDDSSGSSSNSGGTQAATYLDGTYKYSQAGAAKGYSITFSPDGTISSTGATMANFSGTYSINGNELSGTGNDDHSSYSVSGTKINDTSWSITLTNIDLDSSTDYTITKQ